MTDRTVPMPAEITEFVRRHAGRLSNVSFSGWDHGVSDVWDCHLDDGQRVFVKSCRDKYDQELHAYRAWAQHLDDRCPQLVAADDELRALMLTAVDGTLAQHVDLGPTCSGRPVTSCSTFTLSRSSLPNKTRSLPSSSAHTSGIVELRLPVDDDDRVLDHRRRHAIGEIAPLLPHIRRGPCHRDYTPRNWMVDDSGTVRVIDFGHTRADYWILDVDKLWSEHWVDRPDHEAAFWDGYGSWPTEEDRLVLEAVSALGAISTRRRRTVSAPGAISTIVWSREHDDAGSRHDDASTKPRAGRTWPGFVGSTWFPETWARGTSISGGGPDRRESCGSARRRSS